LVSKQLSSGGSCVRRPLIGYLSARTEAAPLLWIFGNSSDELYSLEVDLKQTVLLLALFFLTGKTTIAQTAIPSASPTPSAPAEAAPEIPKDFDPCGGFLELLNKIGNGTACVL
jgi:hypothetical protein